MEPATVERIAREQLRKELGADLARAFIALGEAIHSERTPDRHEFRAATFDYLDRLAVAGENPDPYFNGIGRLALPRPNTPLAHTGLWELALSIVLEWEAARGKHTHKGSGYYFAGLRDISFGNIDRGFLYMHQAAMEDTYPDRDRIPESPAGWFITMNASNVGQAAHDIVVRYEAHLDRLLTAYRDASLGTLDLAGLRARYSGHGELFAPVTAIAHVIARLTVIDSARVGPILNNRFAPNLRTQLALELCLVVEDVLQRRHPGRLTMGGLIGQYEDGHEIKVTTNEVGELNGLADKPSDFDVVIGELLAGGRVTGFSRELKPREVNLVIAMVVRNKAAHGGERPTATDQRFDEIVPRLFFAMFAALEDLYT